MSAPQGSGKTTICEELQHLLAHEGYQAVFASLDDFYLTFDAQQTLAKVQNACSHIAVIKADHTGHNVLQVSLSILCLLKAASCCTDLESLLLPRSHSLKHYHGSLLSWSLWLSMNNEPSICVIIPTNTFNHEHTCLPGQSCYALWQWSHGGSSCQSAYLDLQAHPENPLLQVRGQAGTHDIDLAHETLEQLKSAKSDSSEVGLVRYDKSSHEGRGDRAPASRWQQVKGKVDVVLFEGWMLGFKPLTDQAAEKVILP